MGHYTFVGCLGCGIFEEDPVGSSYKKHTSFHASEVEPCSDKNGYKNLIFKMIERAILDCFNLSPVNNCKNNPDEAFDWLHSDQFNTLCELIEYDPSWIRKLVYKKLKDNG